MTPHRKFHLALLTAAAFLALPGHGQRPADPAAADLHTAVLAAQHGDTARALALTQQLLAKHPTYAPALKFEGALYEASGRDADAESLYEQALKLAPKDPDLLFKVGLHNLAAGDAAQACLLLQRAATAAPRDSETLFYLAQAYRLHGENDLAVKAIARSAQLDPTNAAILQKYGELLSTAGDNLKAIDWLHKAQHLDPTLDRLSFDLAVASFRNEDLEAASQFATQALQQHPNDPKALALMAEIDVKLSHWADAKDIFSRLLAINPDDSAALLGLGHSQLGLKDYQAAVDTLQRLLQQQPTTILAHFYLARAYAGLGMQAESAHETDLHNQLVTQAASVIPPDERAVEKATLVEARQLLADGKESAAVQLFRQRSKGPTATPGAPTMLVGVSYLYMGRLDDADRCLHQALTIEPKVHLAHTYLGVLALRRNNLPEASRQFHLELAQDPNSQLAVAELGEVAYREGRYADAAEQIARSRTVAPDLLYLLTDSYFHLDNIKQADLTAELTIDYSKDDPATTQRVLDLLAAHQQTDLAQRLAGK